MYKLIAAILVLALAAIASAGVLAPAAVHGLTSYSYNVPTAAVGYAAAPIGYAAAPVAYGAYGAYGGAILG